MTDSNLSAVIQMVCDIGGISHLEADQDYYEAGITSMHALPLLLEIEERFQVSVPDDRFINARTARGLVELIGELSNP